MIMASFVFPGPGEESPFPELLKPFWIMGRTVVVHQQGTGSGVRWSPSFSPCIQMVVLRTMSYATVETQV